MKTNISKPNAQGTIEYLVIIAVVVVLALAVTILIIGTTSNSTTNVTGSSSNIKLQSGPIAVVENAIGTGDNAGAILSIANNSGENITHMTIILDGTEHDYNTTLISGDLKNFKLSSITTTCPVGQTTTNQTLLIKYTNTNGITKTIDFGNVTLTCITDNDPTGKNEITENNTVDNGDTTPPSVSLTSPNASTETLGNVDFIFTATDNVSLQDCNLIIDSTSQTQELISTNGSHTITYDITSIGPGTHNWNITCTDTNNNSASATSDKTYFVETPLEPYLIQGYTSGSDQAFDLANNTSNETFVVGSSFPGTYGNLTISGSTSGPFIGKVSSSGEWTWVEKINDTGVWGGNGNFKSVALDSSGNAYVAGTLYGTSGDQVSLGSQTVTVSGPYTAVVAKIDSDGVWQWAKVLTISNDTDRKSNGYKIAVDNSGNAYFAGTYCGTGTLGSSGIVSDYSRNASIFLSKLDSSGNVDWIKSYGSSGVDVGGSLQLTTDNSGNAFMAGAFCGSPSFDSYTLNGCDGSCSTHYFLTKIDSSGNAQWAKQNNNYFAGQLNGLKVNSNNDIYLTGQASTPSFTWDGTTVVGVSGNMPDVLLLKLTSSGEANQLSMVGGSGQQNWGMIAIDSDNNIHLSGPFYAQATFGSLPTLNTTGLGTFFANMDSSGNWYYADNTTQTGTDYAYAISIDPSDNPYITGIFCGAMTYNGTTIQANTQISSSNPDIFVSRVPKQ